MISKRASGSLLFLQSSRSSSRRELCLVHTCVGQPRCCISLLTAALMPASQHKTQPGSSSQSFLVALRVEPRSRSLCKTNYLLRYVSTPTVLPQQWATRRVSTVRAHDCGHGAAAETGCGAHN